MQSLQALLRNVESEAFWRHVVPWLHIDASLPPKNIHGPEPTEATSSRHDHLRTAGYLQLTPLLPPAAASSLARAVRALHSQNLHPTFLYVYDEAWRVLDALRPHLSALLGADFDVLADAWAWHVDPRTDRGGWTIHRGCYEDVHDPSGLPRLLNVWVALTDATERNACMHIVPLSRDPHYPAHLDDITALERLGLPLPIPAGSALLWSANAAHWGGTCDPSFDQPRVSMSFTVRARVSTSPSAMSLAPPPPALNIPAVRLPLSFRERLDLIADQFQTYGDRELRPECNEMRWANAVAGMRAAARRAASFQNTKG